MSFKVDHAKIKRWREERRWSQEHLAELAGLGLRTVQRIETGDAASHDSLMALAAAYNVDVSTLSIDQEAEAAKIVAAKYAQTRAALRLSFWIHLTSYVMGMIIFILINVGTQSNTMVWPLIWWTVGLVSHGATVVIVELVTRHHELHKPAS
ncbi:MAG: helix-turn-helix domain-containing protein [Pseudomonadota bacterium]